MKKTPFSFRHRPRRSWQAFTMVEVTLALGIMAFAMVAIYGLLPVGLLSSRASIRGTGAVDVMTTVLSDLRGTPAGAVSSPRFNIPLASGAVRYFNDAGESVAKGDSRFRVEVTFPAPAPAAPQPISGRIIVSWPGVQDTVAKADGRLRAFVALERK